METFLYFLQVKFNLTPRFYSVGLPGGCPWPCPLPGPQWEQGSADTFISGFWPPGLCKKEFRLVSATRFGAVCYSSPRLALWIPNIVTILKFILSVSVHLYRDMEVTTRRTQSSYKCLPLGREFVREERYEISFAFGF